MQEEVGMQPWVARGRMMVELQYEDQRYRSVCRQMDDRGRNGTLRGKEGEGKGWGGHKGLL